MKKLLIALIMIILSLSLFSCERVDVFYDIFGSGDGEQNAGDNGNDNIVDGEKSFVPVALLYDDFVAHLAAPAFDKLEDLMEQYCGAYDATYAQNNGIKTLSYNLGDVDRILNDYGVYNTIRVNRELGYVKAYAAAKLGEDSAEYKVINTFATNLCHVFYEYDIYNPEALKSLGIDENGKSFYEVQAEKYPPLKEGKSVVFLKAGNKALNLILVDRYISSLDVGYSYEMRKADQDKSGYVIEGSASYCVGVDGNVYTDGGKTLVLLSDSTSTSFAIPDGVTSIGSNAFYDCYRLTSISIPLSVTSISCGAFGNCDNLGVVYYGGSEDDWARISIDENNTALTNAVIYYNSKN